MKHFKLALLFIVTSFSILTSCSIETYVIKGKIGGLYELSPDGETFGSSNSNENYLLNTQTYIYFDDFSTIYKELPRNESYYNIGFTLNEKGTLNFKDMTKRNLNKELSIIIQDEIIVRSNVVKQIVDGKVIVGLDSQ
jgi:preprotein translocase subunit SecD